jgi:UDPglucose--hexose-1-phosphate uridylyltransferase
MKLKKASASYNFFVHYSPVKENIHFHIEIAPRTATWGGFELSTDAIINSVMPEDAAGFYRR